MCFQIPKKIKTINEREAVMEDGVRVKLGDMNVTYGDYLLVYGNMAVEKVTAEKAKRMRKMISGLDTINSSYPSS